jgi:GNAT superfamily N-acetyltransferase
VRHAERDDAEALSALGRALNVQQGDPAIHFTAEAVRRDGFGETPRFEAWIAEIDDRPVGYALVVSVAYETDRAKAGVYIQDVYVAPEARRQGEVLIPSGRYLPAAPPSG